MVPRVRCRSWVGVGAAVVDDGEPKPEEVLNSESFRENECPYFLRSNWLTT